MRTVLFLICNILVAIPATAAESTKQQCDALIAQAFRGSGEEVYRAMSSRTVQNCFRRFPELNYKYFPLTSDKNGMICDLGPSRTGMCPTQSKDPAFSVKMQ